ncbi:DUF6801 domain-containing protein [Streptomyces sp. NPDC048057]|uniref:DUF6801 domain-containing protein n=1 Tax=Streptomyces sp. NPDC048057 TaxID=3155628 RepID=UPI0033EA2D4B
MRTPHHRAGPRAGSARFRTRLRSRTAVRAAVAAAVLVAVVMPGARAVDEERRIAVDLAYTCAFPAGKRGVDVTVTAQLPATGAPGRPLAVEDVTTEVTLSPEAGAELAALSAAEVAATTRLTVALAQRQHRADVTWEGATAGAVPVPAPSAENSKNSKNSKASAGSEDGARVRLIASGPVPVVTPGDTGPLTFTARTLAVDLALSTADGTPTEPSTLALSCTPDLGRAGRLASVDVRDGATAAPPAPSTSAPVPATSAPGRPQGDGGTDTDTGPDRGLRAEPSATPGPPGDTAPPCVGDRTNPLALVAYVTGYANATKQKAAALNRLSCNRIVDEWKKIVPKPDGLHLIQHATGDLDWQGKRMMKPSPATFLTYGFMPTTATMELVQTKTMTIDSDILLAKSTGVTHVRVPLVLRLTDVEVNGVPLDVGPDCRTVGSLYSKDPDPAQDTKDHVVLTGILKGRGDGYQLITGGVLTSTVTIPPFSGCGVGEDLDAVFTSAVSGPGNYIKQVQGAPCASGVARPDARYCTSELEPKDVPKPQR